MWDESWKVLEHPDFTEKPFIEDDYDNWWSLKYTMNIDEMNKINEKVEELDVRTLDQFKFNGCGLVISSDVIKAGVNIPKSSFFVHEDTAFQNMLIKIFGNSINYLLENKILEIPTYIKLDVDGIEHLILQGADGFLNHEKIKSISIEMNENFNEQYKGVCDLLFKSNPST